MSIDDTLKQREDIHGSWKDGAEISQRLKELCGTNKAKRSDSANEALDRICMKLSRIIVGDAANPDHWHDIQGYAYLEEKEISINNLIITAKGLHKPECSIHNSDGSSRCNCKEPSKGSHEPTCNMALGVSEICSCKGEK